MQLPNLESLRAAAERVHAAIPATPQIKWPQLAERVGTEVWVKHENHSPVGAFKLRGGLLYMAELRKREPSLTNVVAATRGNHGQSVAFAAAQSGFRATLIVPHGNNREKNAAMRALGAQLIEHGTDFQDALEYATALAKDKGLHLVPSFDETLVRGVASYALELFDAVPQIDLAYVPIGLGSGICGMIAAKQALGLTTEIVGVVASGAPAYAESFAAKRLVTCARPQTIADGVACRVPDADALEIILSGASRIVMIEESEIRMAMRHLFTDTHNVAEGAGAAALAAALKERDLIRGRRVALIQSGGNVDIETFTEVLAGR